MCLDCVHTGVKYVSPQVEHKSGQREVQEVAVVRSMLTVIWTAIPQHKVLTTHCYWLASRVGDSVVTTVIQIFQCSSQFIQSWMGLFLEKQVIYCFINRPKNCSSIKV